MISGHQTNCFYLADSRPLRDVDGPQSEFAKDKTTGWVKLMTCSCWLVNFVQIQCWPWQILGLQNLVLENLPPQFELMELRSHWLSFLLPPSKLALLWQNQCQLSLNCGGKELGTL